MAVKMPAVLKVGALEYEVVCDAATFLALDETNRGLYGLFDDMEGKVYIRPGLPASQQKETLTHELLHAVFVVSGLNHDFNKDERPSEEDVVNRMAPVLLAALRDNPALVRYFCG